MGVKPFLVFLSLWLSLAAWPAGALTLYWTDVSAGKLQRLRLGGGTGVEGLVNTSAIQPVDIALDLPGDKMYWTEASPADFMISRANLDGSNVQLLVTGLASPSGIELDPANGHIYWTDVGSGKIQRANLDGSLGVDLITTGLVSPVDIALDLAGGKMYWTDSSATSFGISRANLNGSNVEGLVTGLISPSGIALDPSEGKIYWTDRGNGKIQRANLDGSGVEDLITMGTIEPVRVALDLSAGKMYWTEASPADFMISRANLDGTSGEFLVEGLTSPSGIALEFSPSSSAPPPVPDGAVVPGTPLQVSLNANGTDLDVTWDATTCPTVEYNLFQGPLSGVSTYTYTGVACSLGATGSATFTPGAGSIFFVIASDETAGVESGHGFDSGGGLRPASGVGLCGIVVQLPGGTCP